MLGRAESQRIIAKLREHPSDAPTTRELGILCTGMTWRQECHLPGEESIGRFSFTRLWRTTGRVPTALGTRLPIMHTAAYPPRRSIDVTSCPAHTAVDPFHLARSDDPEGTVVAEIRRRHQGMSMLEENSGRPRFASEKGECSSASGKRVRDGNRRIRWLFAERSKGRREGGRGRVARVGDYGEGAAPRGKGTKGGIAAEFEEEGRRAVARVRSGE